MKGEQSVKIEILGTGCAKCNALEQAARAAAEKLGIDCEIEHVTDLSRITGYGVMMTPALVVNGQVKVAGKIPGQRELEEMLKP